MRPHGDPKTVSNWVMVELVGRLNRDGKDIAESPVSPGRLAEMLALLATGSISGKMAKEFFDEMYATGADPADLLKKRGGQLTDTAANEEVLRGVLAANPGPLAEYRAGKATTFNFFVGQAMKATRGKANPRVVQEVLQRLLQEA